MKVLFYLNPQSDENKVGTLAQWASWFIEIDKGIKLEIKECESLFYGHASAVAYFQNIPVRTFGINTSQINKLVSLKEEFRLNRYFQKPIEIQPNLIPGEFTPDVVIAIGDAKFFEAIFPSANILHVEMSPYYRLLNHGVRFCINFTDWQKTSDIKCSFEQIRDLKLPAVIKEAVKKVKYEIQRRFANDLVKIKLNELRNKYQTLCVVPLAESTFSPLRVEVYNIVESLLSRSSSNELFIIADHPLAKALNQEQIDNLRKKYSNFLVSSDILEGIANQSLYLYCDVVYSDFSNAALDSLMFDNLVYRSAITLIPELHVYQDFRNALNSTLISMDRNDSEKIVFVLVKFYHFKAATFFNGKFWKQILSPQVKPISFVDIKSKLTFD